MWSLAHLPVRLSDRNSRICIVNVAKSCDKDMTYLILNSFYSKHLQESFNEYLVLNIIYCISDRWNVSPQMCDFFLEFWKTLTFVVACLMLLYCSWNKLRSWRNRIRSLAFGCCALHGLLESWRQPCFRFIADRCFFPNMLVWILWRRSLWKKKRFSKNYCTVGILQGIMVCEKHFVRNEQVNVASCVELCFWVCCSFCNLIYAMLYVLLTVWTN